METNDNQQHHHHFTSFFTTTTTTPSPNNGLLPTPNTNAIDSRIGAPHVLYPHSVGPSSAAVTTAPVKKRGRPRKYASPEQALAAKKMAAASAAAASSSSNSAAKQKRQQQLESPAAASSATHSSYSVSSSVPKNLQQYDALGNTGKDFTPHIIPVSAGEDVSQKIMLFLQRTKYEICIISASGSISNVALSQPATSGGNIAYEGRYEIISLSGSYVRTDAGGRTGGLSVCLCDADGQIIGGGVGGLLKAAGPVQVIVATFVLANDKGLPRVGIKSETSPRMLSSPVGGPSISNVGFLASVEASTRNPVRGNDDHLNIGCNFMIQPRGMPVASSRPTDWRAGPDARTNMGYDLTGITGHVACQSPENGDYEQLPD